MQTSGVQEELAHFDLPCTSSVHQDFLPETQLEAARRKRRWNASTTLNSNEYQTPLELEEAREKNFERSRLRRMMVE
jgi:hypothetical protein